MSTADKHPGLTVRVYRMNPATGQVTPVRSRTELPAAKEPAATWAWPPCSCPQCRGQAAFIGRRDAPPIKSAEPEPPRPPSSR